ncbi:MAG: ABC transporter ATP-binding protein [Pyramidobacter sp.]|nr:ABC transporter ATP-binding protein [Pyramidobacter sp.]
MAFVTARNLSVGYHRPLIEEISLDCERGQLWGFLGANGAGKSTLLRVLTGLLPPLSGTVLIDGIPLGSIRPSRMARLAAFAQTARPSDGRLTVEELVSVGRSPHTGWFGTLSAEDKRRAAGEIERFGLGDLAHRQISSLSDGEAARASAARAFCQDTPLVLMDEPLAFLDPPRKVELMALLSRRAHEEHTCIIVTLHDIELALRWCDGLILVSQGRARQGTPRQIAASGVLSTLYPDSSRDFDEYLSEITSRVFAGK